MKNPSSGSLNRNMPKTKLFMFLFIFTTILVVANQIFVNIYSQQDQIYTQNLSDLRVLSQELAKNASAIAAGDIDKFEALESSRDKFENSWSLMRDGRKSTIDAGLGVKISLPGNQNLIDANYPNIDPVWSNVDSSVDIIMNNRDQITEINVIARDMQQKIPVVQREYEEVVNTLLESEQSLSTTAVDQRQAWLAERIALNLNLIVSGASTPGQVDQFQRDFNLFAVNHEALLEGDRTLGVNRIAGSEARTRLQDVTGQLNELAAIAQNIINVVPDINGTSNAINEIVSSSESLLTDITGLASMFDATSNSRIASPLVGYVLLLVLLFNISIYGSQVIKQSQAAEKMAAQENKKNNEAVLKLLNEISNLAEGDLTVKATVGEDFTGSIADSFNYAVGHLRELVSAINGVANEVKDSASSSMQTVDSLSEASRMQSDHIGTVYKSIREIGNGITLISKNAESSLEVAKSSVATAVNGADIVKDTIHGMDSIRGKIQDTAKRIKRLGESSQEIGSFVALINDISEHTNTLSLNAAIQAAMAGEAGKGFGVVADEVNALAERSSEATRKIENLVKVIQGDIKEAVLSMEQTTAEVVEGTKLAQNAGNALDDIQKVSKELAEHVDSITDASNQQSRAAVELTDSMEVIQDVTLQTTTGIETTHQFINQLGKLTERLEETVSGFSLEKSQSEPFAKYRKEREATDNSSKQKKDKREIGSQGVFTPGAVGA